MALSAKASSMPTACEPCPGKTNANFITSPNSINTGGQCARMNRCRLRATCSSCARTGCGSARARSGCLEADDGGAPGEAAAHAFDQHVVAALDAAVAHRNVEGERNRGRRGVAMLAHRHHHALGGQAELAAGALHDAD